MVPSSASEIATLSHCGILSVHKTLPVSVSVRAELQLALAFTREGDTLVITKVDRLPRSTVGLWGIVKELDGKGVGLRVLNLGGEIVDTKSVTARLILSIFAGFAQFEREMMLERQSEEIAKALGIGRGSVYRTIEGAVA